MLLHRFHSLYDHPNSEKASTCTLCAFVNYWKVNDHMDFVGMGFFLSEPSQPVQRAISSVVRTSSMKQLLSGLLAAGGTNSMRYVWKKATKAWRSRS